MVQYEKLRILQGHWYQMFEPHAEMVTRSQKGMATHYIGILMVGILNGWMSDQPETILTVAHLANSAFHSQAENPG